MEEFNLQPVWRVVQPIGALLLLGLPVMAGLCLWQTVRTQREGDEEMSRSWADGARSFFGMTVASWVLVWVGWAVARYGLNLVSEMRG